MNDGKTLRILMLEDNPDDTFLIERELKKAKLTFIANRVETRETFQLALHDFNPDVVLSDHSLPTFNSTEAFRICLKERSQVPFILVTGAVSDEFAISCLQHGVDDYILKSNLSRLPAAIHRSIKQRKLETLKREARIALRKQNNELVKLNKELDNFVYNISHNLRSPLTSVMGLINLSKLEEDKGVRSSLHKMMESSIIKLDNILKEILDYSKNERTEVSVNLVTWHELIAEAYSKLEHLDGMASIEKSIEISGSAPFYSDKVRLELIFRNMLSNSIVYCDEAKVPRISIQIILKDSLAEISVKDNGIGIDKAIRHKVFDMFYRGSERSLGAGLGLYIVREIVEKLKGNITLVSEERQGTSITVTLPDLVSNKLVSDHF